MLVKSRSIVDVLEIRTLSASTVQTVLYTWYVKYYTRTGTWTMHTQDWDWDLLFAVVSCECVLKAGRAGVVSVALQKVLRSNFNFNFNEAESCRAESIPDNRITG